MGEDPSKERPGHLEATDFSTFVISLGSNVLVHLGMHEAAGDQPPNLELAKQTIAILGMLEEKTAGNLTAEEEKLLSGILYQVRMAFVEVRDREC
ncbi:MAG: DUF1844 domain-containing protein [Myxococcota bacterium]